MDTYSHAYGNTGHYRRPGTQTSYCGRDLLPEPNTGICTRICQTCAKAEKRDRVEAEQVAADRAVDGPTLAERAGVRYATVGTGRRVHYSPSNDDTLCGREISEYVDGSDLLALLDKGHQLCAPCDRAAEKRAYARSLAAAVGLPEIVEAVADVEAQQAAALVTEAEASEGTWRGAWIGEQPADDALFAIESAVEQGALFASGSRVVCADGRERTVEGTVERTGEPARVVIEGGAEWIAENCRPVREPVVVRMTPAPDSLARIRAKAAADREAYRAHMDERQAAEHIAHGAPVPAAVQARIDARRAAEQAETLPTRRVIEGVIVGHAGTAEGSTPADAGHPNVIAARAALDGLAAALMTDHHDVSEPTEAEHDVRGYLVTPRGGARVAVYWLESGRMIRRDTPIDGAALDCLAHTLTRRGWTVEKMLKSSQCVFAHRPAD
ncbi:hypothetical protein RB628_06885 [Streptomyces sp. ADMS]|uniref:hypothetical protein n=1 Tax=Streptomyces sp. ADMS TaxID=3071415 RepID=UPI00296FABF5|nr:hypothetical protein [Streptomyces sp. ADMS]MDW4905078.1 hypothetical protein [Streptomyces sp. ADMS]